MKVQVRYFRIASFLILLPLLLLLYIYQPSILQKYSANIEDSKFAVRSILGADPGPNDNVVVVTIDEKSVNRLGRWPWSRKVIGDLIEKLGEANIVALDIVFSERSTAEEDEYLAARIADAENVIIGFFFRTEASEFISEEALSHLGDCSLVRYKLLGEKIGLPEFDFAEVNIPEISSGALSCASFNTMPDADGIFRNYPLVFLHKGYIIPTLAMQTLRNYLNRDIELTLDEDGVRDFTLDNTHIKNSNTLRVNFYRDVKEISAYSVLSGEVDSSYFRDKIVIIGPTEIGIYDVRPTPVDAATPGVYLHYSVVSNVLNDELLKSSRALDILMIILSTLLAALFSLPKRISIRLVLYLVLLVSVVASVYTVFIAFNTWVNLTLPVIALILLSSSSEIFTYLKTEAQAAEVKRAFSSYVSPEVVKNIIKNPDSLKLGGEEREVTILFSDIRNFTTISEKLPPGRLVYMLNSLLDPLTESILNNKGMLDKYIGDAIMAIFNAPLSIEGHADKACTSAIEMVGRLSGMNVIFEREGLPQLSVGIGIHTGIATVGNMGSKLRFDYTAIGDTVNLASRLEGLSKMYKAGIIISESTRNMLKESFLTRKLDRVKVKGKDLPITIYELMKDNEVSRKIKAGFEDGLNLYFEMNFEKARDVFEVLHGETGDETAYIFYERCKYYMVNPLKEGWDGVYEYKIK